MAVFGSLLPGAREIRAPLITGYLWLLFAWLLAEPHVHRNTATGPIKAVFDLGDAVTPIGLALAVSVAAYLVGSVSQQVSGTLAFPAYKWPRFAHQLETALIARNAVSEARKRFQSKVPRDDAAANDYEQWLDGAWSDLSRRLQEELDLPAALLVAEQAETFTEVDRTNAEAELRVAVVLPLLALVTILAVQVSWHWALAVPLIGALALQGIMKSAESRALVAKAMRLGKLPSSAVAAFAAEADTQALVVIARRTPSRLGT